MRGLRGWGAAVAVVVLGAGSAGCAVTAGDSRLSADAATICTHGTYDWSGVQRRQELTRLADPVTFPKGTEHYEGLLKPVDDTVYRVVVSRVPKGVGAARVIRALGDRLKTDEPLAGPSEVMRPEQSRYFMDVGDLEGPYYSWGSIGLVEADFTYTCGFTAPVRGHVQTWETVGEGFLPCSEPTDEVAGRTAALLLCPAGSRAAEQS